MKDNPKISIVIPSRNREIKLKRLIESIHTSTYPSSLIEIIVVNNGAPYTSKFKVDSFIQNDENKGLAYARNQGAQIATGKYVLFIDDDNVLDKNAIEYLASAFLKDTSYLAIGPLTYYLSNPTKIWFAGSRFNLWTSKPYFYTNDDLGNVHDDVFPVESLHNCFMVEKKMGDSVGWFDKKIFMNGTEFDLIQRMKKKKGGGTCAIVLSAQCFHDVPTYSKDLIRSLGFENPLRVYYFQRNRAVFSRRYGTFFQQFSLGLIFMPFFFLVYSLLFISKGRWSLFKEQIKGTVSGYYYLFRPL